MNYNKTYIPNQRLIKTLIDGYYSNEIDQSKNQFISSHWQHYSKLFEIQCDANGNLLSLKGVGFGNSSWGKGLNGLANWLFDWMSILSHFIHLPHRRELYRFMKIASKLCKTMDIDFTFDVFRQVCSFELLYKYIPDTIRNHRIQVLMIGDGFGILSGMLKFIYPNCQIYLVDIGKTLLFQAYYLQKAFPNKVHEDVHFTNLENVDFVYCPTEHLKIIKDVKFNIAVNIASMQEMNTVSIKRYFSFLRDCFQPDNNLFYCCNRETKTLPAGEVSEFLKYPWSEKDKFLIDDYCPWHQYFFSLSTAKNGLWLLGMRIPFFNFYDGKTRHRLAIMDCNK